MQFSTLTKLSNMEYFTEEVKILQKATTCTIIDRYWPYIRLSRVFFGPWTLSTSASSLLD